MILCAIYARYSSDLQNPVSIEDQVRTCREYAASRGWQVDDSAIYSDLSVAGASLDRPGLQRMFGDLLGARHEDSPRILLIDDTSRLSRDLADTHRTFAQLKYAGLRAIAISQGIDTEHEQADVLVAVHGLVDSLYVKELALKTHRGMAGQVLRGFSPGGRCFGYAQEKIEGEGTRVSIDLEEAKTVVRIFEMSAEGASLKAIAKRLNAEKVAPPRPRRGRIGTWCPSGIRAMLHNERYTGKVIWNRTRYVKRPGTNKRTARARPRSEWKVVESPDLCIVPNQLWTAVQGRLSDLKRAYERHGAAPGLVNRAASSPHLLTGFLKCGECGANLVIVNGYNSGRLRYGCPQNYQRGACGNGLREEKEVIERGLFAGIREQIFAAGAIESLVSAVDRIFEKRAKASPQGELDGKRRALRSEIERLTAAIAATGHSEALLKAISEREDQLQLLDRQAAQSSTPRPNPTELRRFIVRQLSEIQELIGHDVVRARAVLARHLTEIRMIPVETARSAHYMAEGNWDLLGEGGRTVLDGCGGPQCSKTVSYQIPIRTAA